MRSTTFATLGIAALFRAPLPMVFRPLARERGRFVRHFGLFALPLPLALVLATLGAGGGGASAWAILAARGLAHPRVQQAVAEGAAFAGEAAAAAGTQVVRAGMFNSHAVYYAVVGAAMATCVIGGLLAACTCGGGVAALAAWAVSAGTARQQRQDLQDLEALAQ